MRCCVKNIVSYVDSARQFIVGVRQEFAKVIWPTRKELFQVAGIVLVVVTAFSVYLGVVDLVIGHIARKVLAL